MSCLHIKNNLIGFIEKSLPDELHRSLENHLAECKPCRELVTRASKVYSAFDQEEVPSVNPYFYSKVLSKLKQPQEKEFFIPSPVIRALRPLAVGLVICTLITFGLVLGNYISGNSSQNKATNASTWASDYNLDSNDAYAVDLLTNNEN